MSVWSKSKSVGKYLLVNVAAVVVGVPAAKAAQYTGVYFLESRLGFDGASLVGVLPAFWLLLRAHAWMKATETKTKSGAK